MKQSFIRHWAHLALIVLVFSIGCASSRSVSALNAIATARYVIRDAEDKGAKQFAAKELATAREKLEEAKKATPDVGVRLAAEATVNGRLAAAIATREAALAQVAEAQRAARDAESLRSKATNAVREQPQ